MSIGGPSRSGRAARQARRHLGHPLGRSNGRSPGDTARRRLTLAGAGTAGALGVVGVAVARRRTSGATAAGTDVAVPATEPMPTLGTSLSRAGERQLDPSELSGEDRTAERASGRTEDRTGDRADSSAPDGAAGPDDGESTLVRPRPMWAGVLLLLAGMLATGWAVWAMSTAWGVAGIAMLVVGGGLAWRGGIMADTQSGRTPKQEAVEAVRGEQHHGVDAGDQFRDPDAQATARRRWQRKHALEARTGNVPLRWQPVLTFVLFGLGVWSALSVFVLGYPYSSDGQDAVNRAIGAGVALVLCATWLRLLGRSRVVAAFAVVVGVLLLLAAFLLEHDLTSTVYQEAAVGALTVVTATLVLLGRPR